MRTLKHAVQILLVVVLAALLLPATTQAQQPDFLQIGEYRACVDGVMYRVTGYNSIADATWWNWVALGNVAGTWLMPQDLSPMPYGEINVVLVYYYTSAYGASVPLAPGTEIYFDAYRAGVPQIFDARSNIPVEDCLIYTPRTCTASFRLFSTDGAPSAGVVDVRVQYNVPAAVPEGWSVAMLPVAAGQQLDEVMTGFPCGMHVRVWFTPDGGTPRLLPSQYYPGEYGTGGVEHDGESANYHTSFAAALVPPAPE